MTGVKDDQYSKFVIFNPKAIKDIGYVYGCHGHQTKPKGNIVYGGDVLPLLHYRYRAGGVRELMDRYKMYNERKRGEANTKWKLAGHYDNTETHERKYFAEQLAKCETLVFPGFAS